MGYIGEKMTLDWPQVCQCDTNTVLKDGLQMLMALDLVVALAQSIDSFESISDLRTEQALNQIAITFVI